MLAYGCDDAAETEVRLPGPFTEIDRVEIGGSDGVVLVRDGDRWRLDETPFLVDARRAESLERAFQLEWQSVEDRAVEHTGEALRLVGPRAVPVVVIPTRDQPVRYTQGRSEDEGSATWVLAEHSSDGSLVRGAPQLSPDSMEWRSEEVLGCDPESVVELVLTPGPHVRRSGDGWTGASGEVDHYRVEQLARRLCSLDAEPVSAEPAPEAATHRFEVHSADRVRELALHGVGLEVTLSVDGQVAFILSPSEAEDLRIAHRVLSPTDRLSLVPEGVTEVRIREDDTQYSAVPSDAGWVASGERTLSADYDRWLRSVARLSAYHDAPETLAAFVMPRRSVELDTEEATIRVDFIWRDDENVYARIGGGVPFRTQRSAERILRATLINDQSEISP